MHSLSVSPYVHIFQLVSNSKSRSKQVSCYLAIHLIPNAQWLLYIRIRCVYHIFFPPYFVAAVVECIELSGLKMLFFYGSNRHGIDKISHTHTHTMMTRKKTFTKYIFFIHWQKSARFYITFVFILADLTHSP